MKRIKVLFVSHTVLMAGANRSMLRLIQELRADYDVDPVVIMPQIHKNYKKWNLYKACEEEHIECYSYTYYWYKGKRRLVDYLRYVRNLYLFPCICFRMRHQKFDLIHSNGSVIDLGAFLSKVKGIPHVWHLREFGDLDFSIKPYLGKRYEKWVYSYGDAFIAISNAIKQHYLNIISIEKIHLIYNGIVPCSNVPKTTFQHEKIEFCLVGLVSEGKNQLEALKALNILVNKWHIHNSHLTFIGFEEPIYANTLKEFVVKQNLNEYVTFLGERSDVNELLCHMDVGLMLSNNEAFGRVTVEYMMQGLAVIASDSGANKEIIEDRVSGYIYKLGDDKQLAQYLNQKAVVIKV